MRPGCDPPHIQITTSLIFDNPRSEVSRVTHTQEDIMKRFVSTPSPVFRAFLPLGSTMAAFIMLITIAHFH